MVAHDNDQMDTSVNPNDVLQTMLQQLEEMRLTNEQLRASLTNQETAHREQMTSLMTNFEARLTSLPPPVTSTSGSSGTADEQPPASSSSSPSVSAPLPPRPQLSERLPDPPMFTGRKKDLPLF